MPELPEVETIVNDLKKKVVGKKVSDVWLDTLKLLKRPSFMVLKKEIKGKKIIDVKRRGKNILIYLSGDYLLLIHQKMTGHLLYGQWNLKKGDWISREQGPLSEKVNDYIHFLLSFSDGSQLALSDLRKFAKIVFGKKEEVENSVDLKNLGPEPLGRTMTLIKFKELISSKSGRIKSVLMDQSVMVGIGNIYADEILWKAKVHPMERCNNLSSSELKLIWEFTGEILKKAIRLRGSSVSDYRDTSGQPGRYAKERLAYKREKLPCFRCGTQIKRIKVGSRSAFYCPSCQKLSR